MEYKICPICDQKMTKPHYCDHCRRRIRKPLTIDVDYYLNERHPDTEHDCSYHDYDDPAYNMPSEQTAWKPERQTKPNTPRRQTAVPNQPRRKSGDIPGQMSMPFGQKNDSPTAARPAAPSSTSSQNNTAKTIVIVTVILIAASTILSVFFSIFNMAKNRTPDISALSGYGIPEQWEAGGDSDDYFDWDSDEYESWDLDEADVAAAGVNCNSYGHFRITGEQMADGLTDAVLDMGYSVEASDSFSSNTEDSYGYTSFNKYRYYTFSTGDSMAVLSDTGTDQLHSVSVSWSDADELLQVCGTITALLRDNDDWPLSEAATAAWLDGLKDRLPKLDYDDVTPDGLEDEINVYISSYGSDGYYISFDNWGE